MINKAVKLKLRKKLSENKCLIQNFRAQLITAKERNEIGFRDWEANKDTKYALARDLMHPGLYFHQSMVHRWKEEL